MNTITAVMTITDDIRSDKNVPDTVLNTLPHEPCWQFSDLIAAVAPSNFKVAVTWMKIKWEPRAEPESTPHLPDSET